MMSGWCCRFGFSYLSMRHVKYGAITKKKQLSHVLYQDCCRGRFFTSLFCQDGYTYADCCGSTIAPDCFPGGDATQEWVKDGFLSVAFPRFDKKRCLFVHVLLVVRYSHLAQNSKTPDLHSHDSERYQASSLVFLGCFGKDRSKQCDSVSSFGNSCSKTKASGFCLKTAQGQK